MLILFSQILFGNLSVIRILRGYRSRALITDRFLAQIGTLALLWIAICGIFLASNSVFTFIGVLICIFLTILTLKLRERREIDALERGFSHFLDRWVMNIKLGLSSSGAKDLALNEEKSHLQRLLRAIFHSNAHDRTFHDRFLPAETVVELKTIAKTSHLALSRLENLRTRLRQTSEFRRKSGQATLQARIQSLTMLILLFAMQSFAVHKYGWNRVGDLILISIALSLIGMLIFHWVAQKRSWRL